MIFAGRHYIYLRQLKEFRIWNLSDLHLLSKNCAESELDRDIAEIRDDPHAFWQGGGDYAEYISPRDKRFRAENCDERILPHLGNLGRFTTEYVRDKLAPIKHKCLGLLFGNHEDKYQQTMEQDDLHSWLCTELEVPNLGYCAMYDISFVFDKRADPPFLSHDVRHSRGKTTTLWTRRVFTHHGRGAAQTPGGKLNYLIRAFNAFNADIYFLGHVHDQVGRRQPSIGANSDCTKATSTDKLGVVSGSYLKTYEQDTIGYGEVAMYSPTVLGASIVTVDPHRKEMRGSV